MANGLVAHSIFFELPDDARIIARAIEEIPSEWERIEGALHGSSTPSCINFFDTRIAAQPLPHVRELAANAVRGGYRGCIWALRDSNPGESYHNSLRCWFEFSATPRSLHKPRYLKIDRDDQTSSLIVFEKLVRVYRDMGLVEFTPVWPQSTEGRSPSVPDM
jgi:hypothetical protein